MEDDKEWKTEGRETEERETEGRETEERETEGRETKDPHNEYIDKLTLEMFMNRGKYKKYIANTDPVRHEAMQTYKAKLNKYAKQIIHNTTELLNDSDNPVTTDVGDTFQQYTKALIQYFEMKEIENCKEDVDTEMLFDIDEEDTTVKPSFWGKSKIVKKSGVNSYDMTMFSK